MRGKNIFSRCLLWAGGVCAVCELLQSTIGNAIRLETHSPTQDEKNHTNQAQSLLKKIARAIVEPTHTETKKRAHSNLPFPPARRRAPEGSSAAIISLLYRRPYMSYTPGRGERH